MIFDYIRSSSTLGGMSKVARSQLPPSFEHFSAGRPHTSDVEPSRMGFCATVFIRWMVAKSCTDRWFIPLFIGVRPSKVVQDFFHPQYVPFRKYAFKRKWCFLGAPIRPTWGVGPLQILIQYCVRSHIQRSNHVAWDTNSHVLQGYTANAKAAWTPLAYQQDQQGLDHVLFYVLFSDSPKLIL